MTKFHIRFRQNQESARERRLIHIAGAANPEGFPQEPEQSDARQDEIKKFEDLYGRIDSVDRDVTRRVLAGDAEGKIQLEKIQSILQAMYDAKMDDARFNQSEQIQLAWIRNMNQGFVTDGQPYRFGINRGRVQVSPLLRAEESQQNAFVNHSMTAEEFEAHMENPPAGTQVISDGSDIPSEGLYEVVDGEYTEEAQEQLTEKALAELKEAMKDKDESTLTPREQDKIGGKVMMGTGVDITWNKEQKKFVVTAPENAIERTINMLKGAVSFGMSLIGKNYDDAESEENKDIEPSVDPEDREKVIRQIMEGKTDAEKEQYVKDLTKQMLEAAGVLAEDEDNEELKKKIADLLVDIKIAKAILEEGRNAQAGAGINQTIGFERDVKPDQSQPETETREVTRKATPEEIRNIGLQNVQGTGISYEDQGNGLYIANVAGSVWDIEFQFDGAEWKWRVEDSDKWYSANTSVDSVPEANWSNSGNAKAIQEALGRANTTTFKVQETVKKDEAPPPQATERPATAKEIEGFGYEAVRTSGIAFEDQGNGTYIVDIPGSVWDMEFYFDGAEWKWRVEDGARWYSGSTPVENVTEANWNNLETAQKIQRALARANSAKVSIPGTQEKDPAREGVPDWVPSEGLDAFKKPGEWAMDNNGSMFFLHEGTMYKHDYRGNCESYDQNGMAQLDGKYFDAETKQLVDIPKDAVFEITQQKWVLLTPEEEKNRIEMVAPLVEKALNALDTYIAGAESDVRNAQTMVDTQNRFQKFTNWLTEFKPYDQQLQNARLKLHQMQSTRDTFNQRMENAQSLRDVLDATNPLLASVGQGEVTDSMMYVAQDPSAYSFGRIDNSVNEAMAQNEGNMIVARDVAIDAIITVGTLGAGAGASLMRKGAQVGGRTVYGVLTRNVVRAGLREGAVVGGTIAGGTSIVKNTGDVQSGRKTVGEAAGSVAFDTATGAVLGSVISQLPRVAQSFRKIFDKVDDRAAADLSRIGNGAKPQPQLGDDLAAAKRQAEELKRAAETAKRAEEAAQAKAAQEAREAAEAAAKREAEAAKKAAEAAKKAQQDSANKAQAKPKQEQPKAKTEQPKKPEGVKVLSPEQEELQAFKIIVERTRKKFAGAPANEHSEFLSQEKAVVDAAKKALGITGELTESAVKAAHRKFAVKYHPDKSGESVFFFKSATEAKEILEKYLERMARYRRAA